MTTGALSRRSIRSSSLVFGWRAAGLGLDSLSGLDAYTGQVGSLLLTGSGTQNQVAGQNGASVAAGHYQPRFEQVPARGSITRLVLENVSTFDGERVQWPWAPKIMAMSLFLRVWPIYTPGADIGINAYALQFGNATTGGGNMVVGKAGTTWVFGRNRQGVGIQTSFVESGSTVYPIDVLGTLSAGGQITFTTRDANGLIQNGTTTPTDANMAIATEQFAGSLLLAPTGDVGTKYRYELIKVARGVLTLAGMDLLT